MKTTVNLYQAEFRPQLKLLSLHFILMTWGISLCISLALFGYFSYQHSANSMTLKKLELKQKQNNDLLAELIYESNKLTIDPTLLEKIRNQQSTINFKNRVLNEIQGQDKLVSHGFSDLMFDLANNHKPNLWLTRIHIDSNDVLMQGAANNSTVIPQWVNSLSNTNFFKGQEFSETRLYRDQDDTLNFVIKAAEKVAELPPNE